MAGETGPQRRFPPFRENFLQEDCILGEAEDFEAAGGVPGDAIGVGAQRLVRILEDAQHHRGRRR